MAKEQESPREIVTTGASASIDTLPTELMGELQRDAGKGTSSLARDNIIPMIYVLQPLSPQVNKRNTAYVAGAEPGALWLRNSQIQIVSGDAGVAFQPCHYKRDIVEWIVRDAGGGFVGRHPFNSPDEDMEEAAERLGARPVVDENNPRRPPRYYLDDHELKETRYHSGHVIGGFFGLQDYPGLVMPYVIPLASTGHQVSREWMFMMNQHTFPGDPNKVLPSCSRLYRLTTRPRTNAAGQEWSQIAVADDVGWVPGFPQDLAMYRRGIQLHDAIERGEKQVETPEQVDETGIDDRAERAGV